MVRHMLDRAWQQGNMQVSLSLMRVKQDMVGVMCRQAYPQNPAMSGVVSESGEHC